MPRSSAIAILALLPLFLCDCSTQRISEPTRTATEQLLISSAADRAASQLAISIPKDTKVFVDRQFFQSYDDGYALQAIRNQFLRQGLQLVDDRNKAQAIITVASGGLSTDQQSLLIGIPQLTLPFIPIGNSVTVPEIALFKSAEEKGVAKFVATGYDTKTGKLIAMVDPRYGFSHQTNHTVLLFFSWETGDTAPANADSNALTVSTMANSIPNALGLAGSDKSSSH